MIYVSRIVTVNKGTSLIDDQIVLFKGDRNVEVQFNIKNNPFKNKDGSSASYGQLIIDREEASPLFSEVSPISNNRIVFVITGDMIDELEEVGDYDFQIRLFDKDQESRVTLPPVYAGIVIKAPICEEAAASSTFVNNRKAAVPASEDLEETFDEAGSYNKTVWLNGDIITDVKLNKIENAIYTINDNVVTDYVDRENVVDMINTNNEFIENYVDDVYTKKADMYAYATTEYVAEYIQDQEYVPQDTVLDMIQTNNEFLEGFMDGKYTTEDYVDDAIGNLDYVSSKDVTNMINVNNKFIEDYVDDRYATQDYVDRAVENIEGGNVDLTGYATEDYVNEVLGDIEDLLGGI